jgi:hypothetical protein
MIDFLEIPDEVEAAEQKFTATAEELRIAYTARQSAEQRIEQIKGAMTATNAELARLAADLGREIDSLHESVLSTGKIDTNAVHRVTKLRGTHAFITELATTLGYLRLPEAQLALREAEIAILDALATRFSFRAKVQQARRDVLLGDVVELEGEIKLDENSGKTGEYRRLAAEHRLAADHGRQDLLSLRADVEQRRNQILQLRGEK